MIDKMYRICYRIESDEVICEIYSYPVISETKENYVIQSGAYKRRIKKSDIGLIKCMDRYRENLNVFTIGLEEKEKYIRIMMEKIKEIAYTKVKHYQSIYSKAVMYNPEIEAVEVE